MQADGRSTILGVFTSIPDLIEEGIGYLKEHSLTQFRISLTTLDHAGQAKGSWTDQTVSDLVSDARKVASPSEISDDELNSLYRSLQALTAVSP